MGFLKPKVPKVYPTPPVTPPPPVLEPSAPRTAATTSATATGPAAASLPGFAPDIEGILNRRDKTRKRTLLGG